MAIKNTQAKRIGPARLQKAQNALTAITQLRDYDPVRKEFSLANAQAMQEALVAAKANELAALNTYEAMRDAAVLAEWNAYNFTLVASEQVMAQYGSSSDEFAGLGYKKKSEYKKGSTAKTSKA